jgi:hypothetical protein
MILFNYAEKRFDIPMEFSDFDKKYNRNKLKDKEDIVFQNEYVTIIKNPKSLDKIGSGVRGAIILKPLNLRDVPSSFCFNSKSLSINSLPGTNNPA